ncbi:cytochrome d ubiquinol oxidase subunit II [Nocardia sp. NPDC006630]|uniref:cytochrome d ubiquinol oxidase subunit II n=1 Tax=Nocardia sp. NPDC006630 TaxID=3157181 RepID=UPI0033A2C011
MATGCLILALFCALMYVMLDGYDLGIGILMPGVRDGEQRREMVEIVATAWDANESWIVLLGIVLFGAFPAAYGVMLPALYIPFLVVLLGLFLRGASIEFVSAATGVPRLPCALFGWSSLVTAFGQGVLVGGLLTGVSHSGIRFTGGAFDFFGWFPVLCGAVAVALYAAAGAAYLHYKSEGALRARAARSGRVAAALGLGLLIIAAARVNTATALRLPSEFGTRAALLWAGAAVATLGLLAAVVLSGRARDRLPLIAVLGAVAGATVAVGAILYPLLVPPDITVGAARSPYSSMRFVLIGVGVNIPLLLFYNWFAHRVFRGRYRPDLPAGAPAGRALGPATSTVRR